ncbi:MAG: hypothetical protein MI739_03560 [Bacteroidales bacterium]|nr:hypothetical protein [Bacteroidales bacterium]
MKLIYACLSLLVFIQVSFSQLPNDSYYDIINEAENFFFEKDYIKALGNYHRAFEKYNTPRGNDYYNATIVAFLSDNENLAYQYLEETVNRGYTIEFLKNPIILGLTKDSTKWSLFESRYENLHNTYLNQLKSPIIKELNNMLDQDQISTFNIKSQQSLDSLYYSNIYKLIRLIKKEHSACVESFNMESRKLQSIFPLVILRHYFGMINRAFYYPEEHKGEFYTKALETKNIIEEELLNLIRIGKISPVLISETYCYNSPKAIFGKLGENFCRYIITPKDEYIMIEYITTQQNYSRNKVDSIDINRQRWFMPKFEESLKLTNDMNQLTDSVRKNSNKHFNYTGKLAANEFFLSKLDSLEFRRKYTQKIIDNGYKVECFYLGIDKGWRLPKKFLKKNKRY